MGKEWVEVTKNKPCPACGKPDWCAMTQDGATLKCERTASPPAGWKVLAVKDGGAVMRSVGAQIGREQGSGIPPLSGKREIERIYSYTDAEGIELYQVVRFRPKDFRVRRRLPKNSGAEPEYEWNRGDAPVVLYRLKQLAKRDRERGAVALPKMPVFLCEGEKDAEAVAATGHCSTCSPGGAGKFGRVQDISALGRGCVIILNHPDAPGIAHAYEAKDRIEQMHPAITMLDRPRPGCVHILDLKLATGMPGKDAFDFINQFVPQGVDLRAANGDGRCPNPDTWQGKAFARLCDLAEKAHKEDLYAPAVANGVEEKTQSPEGRLDGGCMADVVSRPIDWLWPDRIALGKLCIIAGDPGTGKSFLSLDLAARCSTGKPWPLEKIEPGEPCEGAGEPCHPTEPCEGSYKPSQGLTQGFPHEPGSVVLMNAEDDLGDTIRPRLEAAGADLSRIRHADFVKVADEQGVEKEFGFDLNRHVEHLDRFVAETPDCKLVIIDPISAYMGEVESHNNTRIRALLSPLSDLAIRRGVAVVAVTHLRKAGGAAIHRTMGSLGFVAAARSVHVVAKDRSDDAGARRFFYPVKSNVSTDQSGICFRLVAGEGDQAPHLEWDSTEVTVPVDLIVNYDENASEGLTALDECVEWLSTFMRVGEPVLASEIWAQAQKEQFSRTTLQRARRRLAVVVSGKRGQEITWKLPGTTTAAP